MKNEASLFHIRRLIFSVAVVFGVLVLFAGTSDAQRRDYMTDDEIELVRENQVLDARVTVLVRMIDRRFTALGINVGGSKPRSSEVWGPEPTGTRLELFTDVRKLLEKAIDDIDGIAERGHGPYVPEKNRDRIVPKAMDELTKAARRYQPALQTALKASSDEKELGAIAGAIAFCEMILESTKK
ncbi:MAG: hypothetical protein H0V76_02685 [Blastocatellia bacterium]|nr:hypothetical protein [Blastocatellia bacterium]